MHKHDQGIDPNCRWCDLDQLLRELANESGPSNLDSYLKTEMFSVWNAHSRTYEERLREEAVVYPTSDRRFDEAVRILVDNGIPLEQAREMINREGWT